MIGPGGGTGIEISKSSTYIVGNIYQVKKQQTGRVVLVVVVEGRKSVLLVEGDCISIRIDRQKTELGIAGILA